jgi:SAM-dependent methyltransferase
LLEPFCGTGRVAIPLARAGIDVTAVDFSRELLAQLGANVARLKLDPSPRLCVIEQDVRSLALDRRDFRVAIVAFNSLLCVPELAGQLAVLESMARHLAEDALLLLDVVNPLDLPVTGTSVPTPFFTRRNPANGRRYTRFAMLGPFDAEHRQKLHGWYDEVDDEGHVRRREYATMWRPIHRFELELMLDKAGFAVAKIEGGHRGEAYSATSPRMFVHARRRRA